MRSDPVRFLLPSQRKQPAALCDTSRCVKCIIPLYPNSPRTSELDLPIGWVTFFLAIATTALAVFALSSSRDTKKLAETMRDQFEASIRPVLKIIPAAAESENPFGPTFDLIVKNIGSGIATDVLVTVRPESGEAPLLSWLYPTLEAHSEQRIRVRHGTWRVSVTGVKDVLGRPLKDENYPVTYPGSPQSSSPKKPV